MRNRDVYPLVIDLMEKRGHSRTGLEIRTKVNNLKAWYKKMIKPDAHRGHINRKTRIFKCLHAYMSSSAKSKPEGNDNDFEVQQNTDEKSMIEQNTDGDVMIEQNTDEDCMIEQNTDEDYMTEQNTETSDEDGDGRGSDLGGESRG